MLRQVANQKIVTGICLPKSLKEQIDDKRGDIPRSRYISRILEQSMCKKDTENQQNTRSQLAHDTADSPHFPTTTHLGVDAANET
jgi:hypothetical protein